MTKLKFWAISLVKRNAVLYTSLDFAGGMQYTKGKSLPYLKPWILKTW